MFNFKWHLTRHENSKQRSQLIYSSSELTLRIRCSFFKFKFNKKRFIQNSEKTLHDPDQNLSGSATLQKWTDMVFDGGCVWGGRLGGWGGALETILNLCFYYITCVGVTDSSPLLSADMAGTAGGGISSAGSAGGCSMASAASAAGWPSTSFGSAVGCRKASAASAGGFCKN